MDNYFDSVGTLQGLGERALWDLAKKFGRKTNATTVTLILILGRLNEYYPSKKNLIRSAEKELACSYGTLVNYLRVAKFYSSYLKDCVEKTKLVNLANLYLLARAKSRLSESSVGDFKNLEQQILANQLSHRETRRALAPKRGASGRREGAVYLAIAETHRKDNRAVKIGYTDGDPETRRSPGFRLIDYHTLPQVCEGWVRLLSLGRNGLPDSDFREISYVPASQINGVIRRFRMFGAKNHLMYEKAVGSRNNCA